MENLKEKKVRDIMIPIYEYPLISATATLRTTLEIMLDLWYPQANKPKTGRHRVIVFDNNVPVGTFGINEMLKTMEPQFLEGINFVAMKLPGSSIPILWEGLLTERCMEVADTAIKKYITPFEHFTNANDTLLRATCMMAKYKVDFLPVRYSDRLVGMVQSDDVFTAIAELITTCESYPGTGTDGFITAVDHH